MRLLSSLLMATLVSATAAAQTTNPSTAPSPSDAKAQAVADPNPPVSLRRIRDALEQPSTPALLPTTEATPTFRVEIRERMKIEDLLSTWHLEKGPIPWGGFYGYEFQRIVNPSVDNPLAQPWSAFNQRELAIVGAQSIATGMLLPYAAKLIAKSYRTYQSRAARQRVAREIAAYCAGQENGGAGIPICEPAPASYR